MVARSAVRGHPTDMIPTRAPSRAPFTVAVGITSGPRTCSRVPVGSKTRLSGTLSPTTWPPMWARSCRRSPSGAGSEVDRIRRLYPKELEASKEAGASLDDLDKRRGNMRYGWLRRNGYCISFSHVEAAARILVARRCKQAGMHWRHHNAACVCAIIARLRSVAWGPPRWTTTSSTK